MMERAMRTAAISYSPRIDLSRARSPKKRLTDVRKLGSEAPRRNRVLPRGRRRKLLLSFIRLSHRGACEDARPALDPRSDHDLRPSVWRKNYLEPRTELDETDALSAIHPVSLLFPADDPPSHHARDLRELHLATVALQEQVVPLVFPCGPGKIRGQEATRAVVHVADSSGHGGTIDVDVEK